MVAHASLVVRYAAVAVALLSCGCQPRAVTELLHVSAVLPAEVQFGDSVQVVGDGFALGSAVSVRLRGAVYRPGRPELRVDLSLPARAESQRELSVTLPRSAQTEFCGSPDDAAHGTFRGDVEVAIAAKARGAPPVTGTLHGAVLELYPQSRARALEEKQIAEGQRALDFFGLEVAAGGVRGLTVVRVAPGSRAVAADIRPGDRIVRAAGVSVLSPSDLVPEPARTLEVGLMRGPMERSTLLDADGFAPRPPRSLSWAAVMVLAAALALVLGSSPVLDVSSWLAGNWQELRRTRKKPRREEPPAARVGNWLAAHVLGLLAWLVVGAALVSPVLRTRPVDVSLGLLALLLVTSTLLLVAALLHGGSSGGRWSLGAGMRAAARQCVVTVPGWIALLSAGGETGSESLLVEGAAWWLPWTWSAFGNPGALVAFFVLLAGGLPRVARREAGIVHARPAAVREGRAGGDLLGSLHLCATCAVGTTMFLSGSAASEVSASALGMSLSSLFEYTALVVVLGFVRRSCLDMTTEQWFPIALYGCLPLGVLGASLAHGLWALSALPPFWHWIAGVYGPACTLALGAGALWLVWRAVLWTHEPPQSSLTPWS